MHTTFYKYQGTGNDFIMIDNRNLEFEKDLKTIKHLCNRKFGVGSDGLIFIENNNHNDFTMDFYNPDGSQSFCGNGSRCAVAFAKFLGIIGEKTTFEAIDGIHEASISGGMIHVKMGDIENIETTNHFEYLNTGSPHAVVEVDDVDKIDMVAFGRNIRYNERFKKEGTNVNVIQRLQTGIKMRTYERGVEHETLSCGTGVTAAAIVVIENKWFTDRVDVETLGGHLFVTAQKDLMGYNNIWLCGPAQYVYKGEIDV